MWRLPLALLPLLLLAAPSARADSLILGLEQRVNIESNLFKSPEDPESDGSYELRPTLRLLRDDPRLRYDLYYRPSFDFYFQNSELDNESHLFRGAVDFAPIPTGVLRASGEVSHYRSISASAEDEQGIADVLTDRAGRVTRVFADLEYEQRVEADWLASGRVGIQSYGFSNQNNVDNIGFDGEARLLHELRSNLALGGAFSGGHRWFEEDRVRRLPASRSLILNGALLIVAEPFETLTIEIQGGPAVIVTWLDSVGASTVNRFRGSSDADGTVAGVFDPLLCNDAGAFVLSECPLAPAPALAGRLGEQVLVDFDPGQRPDVRRDERYTGFVRATVQKEESWGTTGLAYSRWEEASAGLGAASVRDSLTATLDLVPRTHWSVRLRGNWNRREGSDTELSAVRAGPGTVPTGDGRFFAEANGLVPGVADGRTVITQLWTDLRVLRSLLDDRLSLELGFRYLHQEREGFEGGTTEFDNFIGTVGLRYELRPIRYLE